MMHNLESRPAGLYIQPNIDNAEPSTQPLAFPLKHTEVQATVTGHLARVTVTHTFENPFTTTLEATYVFPLPDEAAVDEMEIQVGDRTLYGTIKKRQEAQKIYDRAKQRGQTAGLLEQERPNIFTQSLANIQPGEQIRVTLRYTESLRFEGGDYEFVFPMVVGPRYIPGISLADGRLDVGSAPVPMTLNQDTDQVPDASRLNAPILPPSMRSGYDIAVTLDINAGVAIQQVRSPSHQIHTTVLQASTGTAPRVTLASQDTIPNKDLIVRYQVMGDRLQSTVLSHTNELGGHLAAYLIPAIQYNPKDIVPKDVVFLIDTSGSQMGDPLFKCQELMRRFVMGLNPHDTFNIVNFANTTHRLAPLPLTNNEANRHQAIRYINHLTAGGGTQMLRGIQEVLAQPVSAPGRLRTIVLLTDGYIGNETRILAEVQQRMQGSDRLFSFGAGSSVNRYLLNRIAEIGRGVCRVVRQDEPTEAIAEKFFRQINNPVLTNIQLHWQGDGEPPIFYPDHPHDLYAEQPLVVLGRKGDARPGTFSITGIAAGNQPFQQSFSLTFDQPDAGLESTESAPNPAVAQLWGRARIKALMNQMVSGETHQGVEAVTETALRYKLLSQYTAFVAVSSDVRVNPEMGSVSVQVPVEMPEGVSHAGVFRAMSASVAAPMMQASAAASPYPVARCIPVNELAKRYSGDSHEAERSQAEVLQDITLQSAPPAVRQPPSPASPPPRPMASPSARPPAASSGVRGLFGSTSGDRSEQWEPEPRPRVSIPKVTGLEQPMIVLLLRHLLEVSLPDDIAGFLMFEFQVQNGRVKQVVLTESSSNLQPNVIDVVRRSLMTWKPERSLKASVDLVIRISKP
ncbi:MAG: after-VIT domain-containing protein [Cyanothece sp. SIO2G6]|nr:after-VIT domain-containing protein [Cyanothece sp. SIO2G6]